MILILIFVLFSDFQSMNRDGSENENLTAKVDYILEQWRPSVEFDSSFQGFDSEFFCV